MHTTVISEKQTKYIHLSTIGLFFEVSDPDSKAYRLFAYCFLSYDRYTTVDKECCILYIVIKKIVKMPF